jgi:hypothetical protein
MGLKFNPFTGTLDIVSVEDLSGYLTLDQTTPQTILNDTFKLDVLKSKSILGTDADGKIIEGTHQDISGKLDTGGWYDTLQSSVDISGFNNDAGYLTTLAFGDLTSIPTTLSGYGISDTKANFDTALSDGTFAFAGGAFHDGFSDYVSNEHIDWTSTTEDLTTTGDISTAGLTVSSAIDWSGGNTIYVPIDGNIADYITAATSGDTLQLAAGTYTITSTITVDKKLHIRGMGRDITTISTGDFDVFNATADGVLYSDLTVAPSGNADRLNKIFDGTHSYNARNVYVHSTMTRASAFYGTRGFTISATGKTVNLYDCEYFSDGVVGEGRAILMGTDSAASTINAYNFRARTINTTHATSANVVVYISHVDSVLNLYNPDISCPVDRAAGIVRTDGGTLTVYGGTINGSGASAFDVQWIGGTLTLYNTTLVNNTTSGTITYAGTVVSGTVRGVHKTQDNTAAVADGDYTVGKGTATDGVLTIKDGLITAITEATDA